jgi:hypothetical protein
MPNSSRELEYVFTAAILLWQSNKNKGRLPVSESGMGAQHQEMFIYSLIKDSGFALLQCT